MEPDPTRYRFDTVEVQPAAFTVLRDGRPADLEPKAVRVLIHLIRHRDRAVTKEELVQTVWEGAAVTDNALTRVVAQIRRGIGDDAHHPRFIQTLPTTGYRFIGDVTAVSGTDRVPAPRRHRRWAIAAAAAAGVVLALAGWRWIGRNPGGSSGAAVPVQITTSRGLDIGARFSPDGKAFAYSSNRSGRFEIYSRAIEANGPETRLTSDGKQNLQPAWSPDGAWIAYHSVAGHGIWVMPSAGGAPRRLTAFGADPVWSPDGQRIAFRSAEPHAFTWLAGSSVGQSLLWVVAADGSQLRRVTTAGTPPGLHSMPAWSPDSRRIVFVGGTSIWSIDPASGNLAELVRAGRDLPGLPGNRDPRLADPAYGPAGQGLCFTAAAPGGEYAVYCQARPGDRPREIHRTGREQPSGMAFSPDGKRLLLTRISHASRLETVRPGADPAPLFNEAVLRAFMPSFSPDGKFLAFGVQRAGRSVEQWIMNADGTNAAPVTADNGRIGLGTTWNRQGQLLYKYSDGSRVEFRRYDPVRKTTEVLASQPFEESRLYAVVMPDEREAVSVCLTPRNLCLTPLAGGSPRQLTFYREDVTFPFVSHDGDWIMHNAPRGDTVQIGITDRHGRRQEVLTDDPGLSWGHSFSADNRRVAFAAYRDGVWNIWWIDRITRERRQLTHYTAYGSFVRTPAWRPGTEEVVYEQSQAKGNVYMLAMPRSD